MEFFVDSNIIIETFKENYRQEAVSVLSFLLNQISKNRYINCYINNVVESEVTFQLIFKGKSSLTKEEIKIVLLSFKSLEIGENIRNLFWEYMCQYNLKPNDSLILATCKYYGIPYLISFDSDFENACKREGITLINSFEKLRETFHTK